MTGYPANHRAQPLRGPLARRILERELPRHAREEGTAMRPSIDKIEFAALARRSGVPLTDEDIATLYEGYGMVRTASLPLSAVTD